VTNTVSGTVIELTETTTAAYLTMCPTSAGVAWSIILTCGEIIGTFVESSPARFEGTGRIVKIV